MYFQKSHFIAVTFYIQMVYSDLTLSESGPPYACGERLKLKCWSDSVACCNLTTKRWTLQGIQIMNDGVDVSGTGKYTETRNDAEKYFELTIKNLQLPDFGKKYACLYEFDTSPGLTLKASHLHCSPCDACGWECFGWACLGTLIGNCNWIIGILLITCATGGLSEWCFYVFLVMLVFSLIFSCLPFFIIPCLCLFIYFKVWRLFIRVQGSTVEFKHSYKAIADKTIIWEKIDGVKVETYSIKTKINQNFEVDLKSRIKVTEDFHLIIENVKKSDEGTYQCSLSATPGASFRNQLCVVVQPKWKTWCCLIGVGIGIIIASFVLCILLAVPIARRLCFCYSLADSAYRYYPHLSYIFVGYVNSMLVIVPFAILWKSTIKRAEDTFSIPCYFVLVVLSFFIVPIPFLCLYIHEKTISIPCRFVILLLSILIVPIPFVCFYIYYKDCIRSIVANIGSTATLTCPYKAASGHITWIKQPENGNIRELYSEATGKILLQDSRLKVEGRDLFISNVEESDAGIYMCVLSPKPNKVPEGSKLQLIVSGGGKSQSVESGSSCWPICRVGQDPNTASSDPEKVRRSPPKKRKSEKKKDEKPTEVVRPLPPKAQHLKTDNKERTAYSDENETFSVGLDKGVATRPLPSIGQLSSSPRRPLPQMPTGPQQEKGGNKLEPLLVVSDSSPEKKRTKKRKKKETKQTEKDNSTDF